MSKNKLEYFIVFNWQTNTESGIGNQAILLNKKISTIEYIREIEKIILKENPDWTSIVITNFILFNKD